MDTILNLHNQYMELHTEKLKVEEQIADFFDQKFVYHDIPISIVYWDETTDLITICPIKGSDSLWNDSKFMHLTFKQFNDCVGILVEE